MLAAASVGGVVLFFLNMWGDAMQALISPNEEVYNYDGMPLGARVAQVSSVPFEVCEPLFWVDCSDDVTAALFYYDLSNGNILSIPQPPIIMTTFLPNPVLVGQDAILTWNVSGATAVMLSSYGTQSFPLSGTQNYTYQTPGAQEEVVTAVSPNGNLSKKVFIQVVVAQDGLSSSGNPPVQVI